MPNVKLFALSTCIHCKRAKQFLDDNNVDYDYLYVDTLQGDERAQALEEMTKYNKAKSFPTLVFNGGEGVVVGFHEDKIREALGQ